MSYTLTFGGSAIEGARTGYRAVALTADTTLRWPNLAENSTDVAADEMDVTPDTSGWSLTLPDARQVSPGRALFIANVGADSFTLKDNGGSTVVSIGASVQYIVYLRGNSTAAGTWRAIQLGATTSAAQAASLESETVKNISGSLNAATPVNTRSGSYTVGASERGNLELWTGGTGTITLPAVSGNTDFYFYVRNAGSGTLTLDPDGSEMIDGTSTVDLASGEACIVFCNGSAWYTVGQGRSVTFTASRLSLTLSATTTTLSSAQSANLLQDYSGSATQALEVIVPASVARYYVANLTTGTGTVTVKTATGSGVALANGAHKILKCDGATVFEAVSANAGTVTTIATATGLTGGPITTSGTIGLSNPLDVSGQIFTIGPGTATAPAYAFNGRAMMGLFSPAAGVAGISSATAGTTAITFTSNAYVAIGATSATTQLAVTGTTALSGPVNVSGVVTLSSVMNEAKGADISTASTADTSSATGNLIDITATGAITGLGTVQAGARRTLRFLGGGSLTHSATGFILPGAANITTASGDTADFYSLGSGAWVCSDYQRASGAALAASVPVGTILDYAGTSAPTGFLLCYGQNVSRTTYAALFAAIGTTFGTGDGVTTFGIPDLRGRVAAGKDDMGGASANRLTDQSGGLDGDVLGDTGGAETHQLTTSELAAHTHGQWNSVANHADYVSGQTSAGTNSTSGTTGSAGGDTAHNNVQPTIILNKIIYAGA